MLNEITRDRKKSQKRQKAMSIVKGLQKGEQLYIFLVSV